MVLALKYKKAIHWLHENSYISIILDGEIIYSWMLYNSIGQGCALFLYTIATYPLPL